MYYYFYPEESEENAEYQAFVDKFKPKLTTDDCYTPPLVYEVVKQWACEKYGIDPAKIVRPFYPGGDYENFDYSGGKIVVDNPPFSILAKICEFYLERKIAFFLFAPALTAFSGRKTLMRMNHILCDCNITYENGAIVRTGFVTSFGGDIIAQTAPDLKEVVDKASAQIKAGTAKELPKYTYPDNILTAAMLQRYSKYGIEIAVRRSDCAPIYVLDAQRDSKKTIFGGGLLLSERAAAERAAAHIWELSEREKKIVAGLGKDC